MTTDNQEQEDLIEEAEGLGDLEDLQDNSSAGEEDSKKSSGENSEEGSTEEKLQEMESRYLRALADYQNLLRQHSKEKSEMIKYANETLILSLLPVYDNLRLSIKHFGESEENWLAGIRHITQQFKSSLEEAGVKEVETGNLPFDPLVMEAVETRESLDQDQDNLVAEELKPGYLLGEKVIIPARVAVYAFKKDQGTPEEVIEQVESDDG
ncbi:MAG: nucleotide exchange factor GrpE [Patescibacteria group bacterium]|nr:MAG: nucleotide exchange factor GrpE [Patescibacteria group bacterium]